MLLSIEPVGALGVSASVLMLFVMPEEALGLMCRGLPLHLIEEAKLTLPAVTVQRHGQNKLIRTWCLLASTSVSTDHAKAPRLAHVLAVFLGTASSSRRSSQSRSLSRNSAEAEAPTTDLWSCHKVF
jgi:hypothetical protein